MAVRSDPEGNEVKALNDLVDFEGKTVLEIGCGDGRLTQRYAAGAERVVAIDPYAESIKRARNVLPKTLDARVDFIHTSIDDFAIVGKSERFDLAILSWSL